MQRRFHILLIVLAGVATGFGLGAALAAIEGPGPSQEKKVSCGLAVAMVEAELAVCYRVQVSQRRALDMCVDAYELQREAKAVPRACSY